MSLTIQDSFDSKLPREPDIIICFKDPYREFRSTVPSTMDTEAPLAYLKEDISVYAQLSERSFPRLRPFSPIREHMPLLENTHRLETEADVSRLSVLQLIHPVNIALQEICPPGTRIICNTEASGGASSRFDVQWSLYSNDGKLLIILAILEIKNTHIIHRDDFTPAGATEQNLEEFKTSVHKRNAETLLRRNAVSLSKQAAKYARKCPYVALFDWNAMFVWNFINQRRNGVPEGTYFDEFGQTRGMTFRRLLFAFVARPLKRWQITSAN